jgi:putative PEP-CTERM system integral membrane protein
MKKIKDPNFWAYGLFWSWNVIFLTFMLLGFAPALLPELVTAVQTGTIPINFLIYGSVLAAIPLLAVILGLTWLRREPGKLFILGYGIEGPLMLVLAFRFFLIQQAIPAVTFILWISAWGVLTLLWTLLDRKIDERGRFLTLLRAAGLTLLFIVGMYASVWLLFYIIPILAQSGVFLTDLGRSIWDGLANLTWDSLSEGWRFVPFAVLGVILFLYTATLFVLTPIAVPIIYARAWRRSLQALRERTNTTWAAAAVTAVFALCLLLFIWTDRQPQQEAFALLTAPPATLQEAEALLAQEEKIRAGLLNAYLAPQRYLSAQGEMDHVRYMYEGALHMKPQHAIQVQHLYEKVARPILYKPVQDREPATFRRWDNRVFLEESAQAAELYAQFFDEPITDGEKETIVRAMRSTWMPEQARAGWQAVDDREIYLARQEITVAEQGDWADVALYEVYENQTGQRQEVVYYFSLPETAVITGLWLGDSADKSQAFSYHVAPRGAAQAVYRNEVRRNIDPALVEQIGPTQYRLRVFPIEPQQWQWDEETNRSTLAEAPPMHLWLTYRTMADGQTWPLPNLSDLRNVYWDEATVRLVNGMETAVAEPWLPAALPAAAPITPAAHQTQFADGQVVLAQPASAADLPEIPAGLQVAVVLDRSRSMAKLQPETAAALDQLRSLDSQVDVYLTAAANRGEAASVTALSNLDPAKLVYFGGQDAADLLTQFNDLHADQPYDIILVLTDSTGYGLSEKAAEVSVPAAPLWMVHLGGKFPLGYDDGTLAAIQGSGGGVAAAVDEALARWSVKAAAAPNNVVADLVDGYLWQTLPAGQAVWLMLDQPAMQAHQPANPFAAMAARQVILAAMQRHPDKLAELPLLDSLHALAQAQSIVTPYSSMIVLVTERQEQLLKALEDNEDRFDREFEEVGETQGVTVTGVPEPEEWLLLGITAVVLAWYWRKSRLTPSRA